MSTKSARAGVADTIASALTSWNVYAEPPETAVLPAVVLVPRTPYAERLTVTEWTLALRVAIDVHAARPSPLDEIDDAIDALRSALLARTDIRWDAVQEPIRDTSGDVPRISAAIDIVVIHKPGDA